MKRVLVTGARGFLGSHCLPLLVAGGYEVHAVSQKPMPTSDGIQWHYGDLLQAGSADRVCSEISPTHLLHLAWETAPSQYWTSPQNLRWLSASIDLMQRFQDSGGQRLVSAGTCAEYDWQYGLCRESITPLVPRSLYGKSKLALSQLLETWSEQIGLSAATARIFFMYGPGSPAARFPGPVISALLAGQVPECSHGRQVRDYLYVSDAASALVAVLDSKVCGPINIGSGKPITLRELVSEISSQFGGENRVRWGAVPTATDDPPWVVADTTRLNREVAWQPQTSLRSGIQSTIEHARRVQSHST
ncbi:dTDP-glucose 4,6-dehydratase 2 [Rosistilla ulvae]|uniref:dTDP-glucose 4,6-dehydratase 2 n=1 Tax=Rosistilla ulvae TaxID=1930277 RepID=A0A517LYQ2_9BACT|nr:dTDP-glucose 4,6-dehydratase 2 [Rosistilla ulvae]